MDNDKEKNGARPPQKSGLTPRQKTGFAVAVSGSCGVAVTALIVSLCTGSGLLLFLSIFFFAAALVTGLVCLGLSRAKRRKADGEERGGAFYLPFVAIALDLSTVGFFFLGTVCFFSGWFLTYFGLLFYLMVVVAPIGGIGAGIGSLCTRKEQKLGKPGIALSVTAIALPVVTVIVLCILFGTGVAVIRLM